MKTGEAIKSNQQKLGLGSALLMFIIGRVCERRGIVLETQDTLVIAGAVTSALMYIGTHWKTSRIARIADAVGDRVEHAIRNGVDIPDPSDGPGSLVP